MSPKRNRYICICINHNVMRDRRYRYITVAIALLFVCTEASSQEQDLRFQETFNARMEVPTLAAPMYADTLRWQRDLKINSGINFAAPTLSPNISHMTTQGKIATLKKGVIEGGSQFDTMLGLMNRQRVAFNVVRRFGNFSFVVGLSATKYALPVDGRLGLQGISAVQNQFGIGGAVTYDFSDNVSATIYGQYVSNPFFHSMAAFPYVATSSFGGFVTFRGSNVGLDLGVNNRYDPFAHRWQTDPIIRPTFKIGRIKTDIDFGPLVKDGMLRIMGKKRQQGPIIMPSR